MLINCPECNGSISSMAQICPHCGYPLGAAKSIEYIPSSGSVVTYTDPQFDQLIRKAERDKANRGSILLLIAAILGLAYITYSFYYWLGVSNDAVNTINNMTNSFGSIGASLGAGIAVKMVTPHLICTGIAVLFNILTIFIKNKWFALTAGILYSVAMVLFFYYFFFVIAQALLCYIAFARMANQ